MIKEIRDYIEASILEVDSRMVRHEEAFTSENIPSTMRDDSYFVRFGQFIFNRDDTAFLINAPIEVELYTRLYSDSVSNFDIGMERAVCISSMLLCQERMDQNGFMKAINSLSIRPEAIINDDKTAKYTIELNVTIYAQGASK